MMTYNFKNGISVDTFDTIVHLKDDQLINQSVHQSINQSINQLIK